MDPKATRDAYGEALAELAASNPDVVVLDADLSGSTRTSMFRAACPERFFNCGIAELNMVGMAAGFAAMGKVPYVSTFAVFGAGRAYDAIRNAVCYPNLPVKFCFTHAGLTVGEDGATHQMLEDIALMSALPNMTVLVPADAIEARQMVLAAAGIPGPVYIRLGREAVPAVYNERYDFVPGAVSMLRDGTDVTIAACGIMVNAALEAAKALEDDSISACVLNVSSLKPMDTFNLVASAKKTTAVVTAEEHSAYGGLSSIVASVLALEAPDCVLERVALDGFGQSGKPEELLEHYRLTSAEIVAKTKIALRRTL